MCSSPFMNGRSSSRATPQSGRRRFSHSDHDKTTMIDQLRGSITMRTLRAFLLAAAIAPALRAQQADTTRLPNVVVTATRVTIDVLSSPATVAVVTGDDLRR